MTFQHMTTSGTHPEDRRRGVSTLTGYRYYAHRLEAEIADLKEALDDVRDFKFPGVPHPEGPVPHSDPEPWHPDHHDDSPIVAAGMLDGMMAW